ncbi:hypothetical protein G7046_g9270 [Stylonectria norvegica]|nr:hypothetical protein G7046_g9270 [Stylonectria norvegica]
MPPLPGFTNSPLRSRDEVVQAAKALLRPLGSYTSTGCSRVRIPVTSGTLYDETAAQIEGFARPIWVVGSLLMSGDPSEELTAKFITGLENGTDPYHEEYWGDIGDFDQRMVETETISYALLASPRERIWDRLSPQSRSNIAKWFVQLNGKELPRVNWLWFRVFTNLVLRRFCDMDTEEIRTQMEIDLKELDTFYLENGWSSDGKWRSPDLDDKEFELLQETGKVHNIKPDRCADFYSGSFAIQFSQLLFLRVAGDLDPVRTENYRQQARDFGSQIWRYFDAQGAVIPFGRSLIYRFACGAFFSALALAKVPDMPKPLDTPGAMKGFILRHLRWWARNSSDTFHSDGTLNFGWIYPNMYLTEDYNSPQSAYWALKAFIAIGLPADNPFWAEPEPSYPKVDSCSSITLCRAPRQIICNRPGSHHFLLSSSQFTSLQWKGGLAKYGKFAYSSAFGFSVPTGQASLQQLAPDNMLAFSKDGTQTWATKWKCREASIGVCRVIGSKPEELPVTAVVWYPWEDRSVTVTTTLIPPSERWPDWHVRVHRIRINIERLNTLHLAEGGFAIDGRCKKGGMPLRASEQDPDSLASIGETEAVFRGNLATLIASKAGVSGLSVDAVQNKTVAAVVSAFQPEANTNIMAPRTLIPLAEYEAKGLKQGDELVLVTKVFAVSATASESVGGRRDLASSWLDRPVVRLGEVDELVGSDYIDVTT